MKLPILAVLAAGVVAICVAGGAGAHSAAPGLTTGLAYMTGHGATGNNSVWLASPNGRGAHRLGPGFGPLLSPDGRKVAAFDERTSGLILYSWTGTVIHRFYAHRIAMALAWSRDSRYLAVGLEPGSSTSGSAASLAVIDTWTRLATTVARGAAVFGATFAPSGPARLVFGLAKPLSTVNLYEAWIARRPVLQLTRDGHSLNPLWGARGIVFDRETPRTHAGSAAAPEYQLWVLLHGHFRQITHMNVFWLLDGLVPLSVSGDGTRLAANLEGQDTDQAWSVNLLTGKLHQFPIGLAADGISRDGRRVLLEPEYAWMYAPQTSVIETMPFSGGRATRLVKPGGKASWNQ